MKNNAFSKIVWSAVGLLILATLGVTIFLVIGVIKDLEGAKAVLGMIIIIFLVSFGLAVLSVWLVTKRSRETTCPNCGQKLPNSNEE